MQISRVVLYCLIVCLMPFVLVAKEAQDIVITQTHYQVPVLLQKTNNPVVRIHMHIEEAVSKASLTEMVFSTAGSNDLKDIKQLRLFYVGADSGMYNLGSPDKLHLFGESTKAGEKLVIKGDQALPAGDHWQWPAREYDRCERCPGYALFLVIC